MCSLCNDEDHLIPRRDFIKTVGVSAAGISLGAGKILNEQIIAGSEAVNKDIATICGAFLYPPTSKLDKEGYYSWPGSDFKAEARQIQYLSRIKEIESNLGVNIKMDEQSLDTASDVDKFISKLKTENPDGLLLIPFKKSHYDHIIRIVEQTKIPTVVLATLGVLLIEHIMQLRDHKGVYLIHSLDDLNAVESGLKMIRTWHWMNNARIVCIDGKEIVETKTPFIGTRVKRIPHQRFYDYFASQKADKDVLALANQYASKALKIVQPTKEDIIEAAKNYFIFKKIITEENADALMMNCLPGLREPRQHVPPCMGFMSLHDEGIPMGCQADLNATITMMLGKGLFSKPGFMHNVSYNTEKNLYFCAHCTSPSMMNGIDRSPEPYELMSHCEAGWGTVPRVIFKKGQEITIAKYMSDQNKQQLFLYSGEIVDCPPIPPTGGCRTNVQTTINELKQGSDMKGRSHMVMFYGNHVNQFRHFCQLYDI